MKICIAGWYFHEPLMKILRESKFDYFVVAHKPWGTKEITGKVVPNVGLEFGCYNWYLVNEWKDENILFMHDDNDITENALNEIAKITQDQCYLFSSKEEADVNGQIHGRAFFCSEKFLRRLKADGGFWFDEGNGGKVPPTSSERPDYHNLAIKVFREYLRSLSKDEFKVGLISIVQGLKNGYRGRV